MKNRHVSVSELTRVSFQIDTCRLLIRHIAVWGLLTKKGATTWRVIAPFGRDDVGGVYTNASRLPSAWAMAVRVSSPTL